MGHNGIGTALCAAALLGCVGGAAKAQKALQWAETVSLPADSVAMVKLPPELRSYAVDGQGEVAKLTDGRVCVLLVRAERGHGNFEGLFACSGDVTEIYDEPNPNAVEESIHLRVDAGRMSYMFIRKKYDDRTFAVYFDLN
jgi:hypothetical protein